MSSSVIPAPEPESRGEGLTTKARNLTEDVGPKVGPPGIKA